ncbi:hypothetical protein VTI28DRAFT_8658 [Corynascus sepedonium]
MTGIVQYRKSLTSLSAPYQSGSDWARVREDAIALPRALCGKGARGPRTLASMCCRVLAGNLGAASKDSLQGLPHHLLWSLWKELHPRERSLHAWNTLGYLLLTDSLQSAIGKEDDSIVDNEDGDQDGKKEPARLIMMALFRYRQEIINPPCDLSIYISPLANLQERSLVYLCIDNVARFQTHELIALATLPQLAVLEIIERDDTDSKISDALMKGWTEAHTEPFQRLRVLKITSKTHWITEHGLQYLLKLAALEIIDISALSSLRLRLSRRTKDILDTSGWKVTGPKNSLFVSYAEAFLDGRVAVHPAGVDGLETAFEEDRQPVVWAGNRRSLLDTKSESELGSGENEIYSSGKYRDGKADVELDEPDSRLDPPNFFDVQYLDDGWRALLQGNHPSSVTEDGQARNPSRRREEMTDDQVFWFLALLDQTRYDRKDSIRGRASGVALPIERLVSLRLCNPTNTAEQSRRLLNSERLIFFRDREHSATALRTGTGGQLLGWEQKGHCNFSPSRGRRVDDERHENDPAPRKRQNSEAERPYNPSPSWVPRPNDRKEKGLKPRKRLKKTMGDILMTFIEPQRKSG